MKTSENIDQICKAMSIAQGEIKPASKSTVNPFFKSTYSTLAQVMEVIREPMAKNNLCYFQDVVSTDNNISISTRVCHSSGQWLEFGPLVITLVKKDAQSIGSASSYGKRYGLCAALGVVSDVEDDDGEKAMSGYERNKPKQKNENQNLTISAKLVDNEDTNTPTTITEQTIINKEQIKQYNELYEKCSPEFLQDVDKYYHTLNLSSLAEMDQKTWFKFMKSFEKHLNGKKS